MPTCNKCSSTGECHACHGKGVIVPGPIAYQDVKYATGVGTKEPTSISRREPIYRPIGPDEKLPPCALCHGTGICQFCKDQA